MTVPGPIAVIARETRDSAGLSATPVQAELSSLVEQHVESLLLCLVHAYHVL
jgi:hypothetical protein